MKRMLLPVFLLSACLVLPALSRQQPNPHIVDTDPLSPEQERQRFRLPPGFEAQLVAAEPDIFKPMNIAFDDQGRLWVTDSLEYPFPARPGVKPRDTVKILEDFGPDGRARKISTFADGLNIPIGVLPLPGAVPRDTLVYGIPSIYRLRDTKGGHSADQRDSFYSRYETRDTHGMTNNFMQYYDGWIYACHGFANTSKVKGADGNTIVMNSGNTYRMKPDGSHVEQFTWGQVNPFGLATDPLGYIYTSDCHSEPIYQLIRGAYYPSFGKPHDGLGFAPQMFTGYKGSTAIAGIAYYDADAFPAAHRGTAFVGDVVTNQIVQFRMTWQGASPKATEHVFMDCKDRWFRPVDVKLGPDGALYIADFYNRIIGHYEVPLDHPQRDRHRGRIWRIVYKGKDVQPAPVRGDWTGAQTRELLDDLQHPNIQVRLFATHALVQRGGKDVIEATKRALATEEEVRPLFHAHALWVLERLGGLDADTLKAEAAHPAENVRVHVRRILADRNRWTEVEQSLALAGLGDRSPHVQRVSAEAVGLHADPAFLRPLLDLRQKVPASDTHRMHTVRLALRNQLRPADAWKTLGEKKLSPEDARAVADVALGVPSAEAAAFIVRHLSEQSYPLEQVVAFTQHVARHGSEESQRALLAFVRGHQPEQPGVQAALARAVDQGTRQGGRELSEAAREWLGGLTRKLLASTEPGNLQQGIELTRDLRFAEGQSRLAEMIRDPRLTGAHRQASMEALMAIDSVKHARKLGEVLIDTGLPLETREQAGLLLAQANRPETRDLIVSAMPSAPARLQNSLAQSLAGTREGAESLLQAIGSGKASARLLLERGLVVRLEASRVPQLKERMTKLTAGLPPANARLAQQLTARRSSFLGARPDPNQGAAVFEKNCGICHQVAGKGAKVGPQLDGIGLRGLERLLEDTLDPNRNVDEAFRTTRLVLSSGKTIEGLMLREEGAVLVLADQQGKEVRVEKKDIEERGISPLSPMPANFLEQISEADFNHLLAYLLALKPSKP